MKTNYQYALQQVLKSEGGYSNNAADPGGPTDFGITLADYRSYINSKGIAVDVKNMTVDQAKAIYKSKYWDAVNGDGLPSGVDYCVFDYGVNSGVNRVNRIYNKVLKTDNHPANIINAICDERLAFLKSLKTWPTFGKGWSSRVAGVRKDSIELVGKTDSTTHGAGTAGAIIVAGGAAASQVPVNYMPYIIIGTVVVAIVGWLAMRWYKQNG